MRNNNTEVIMRFDLLSIPWFSWWIQLEGSGKLLMLSMNTALSFETGLISIFFSRHSLLNFSLVFYLHGLLYFSGFCPIDISLNIVMTKWFLQFYLSIIKCKIILQFRDSLINQFHYLTLSGMTIIWIVPNINGNEKNPEVVL